MSTEKTLILVKPDGVRRQLIGEVISRVEAKGYLITSLRMMQADRALLERHYEEHKGKYKALKDALLADILAFVTPMRERRAYYESQPELVAQILEQGAQKAKTKAKAKMEQVRKMVGLE